MLSSANVARSGKSGERLRMMPMAWHLAATLVLSISQLRAVSISISFCWVFSTMVLDAVSNHAILPKERLALSFLMPENCLQNCANCG